ncbi:MAG: hypothetical protein IJM30_09985 [Thermoguttaceae bacterium]|nr:hypothetical protein [Thermoguttaceae bacterium]
MVESQRGAALLALAAFFVIVEIVREIIRRKRARVYLSLFEGSSSDLRDLGDYYERKARTIDDVPYFKLADDARRKADELNDPRDAIVQTGVASNSTPSPSVEEKKGDERPRDSVEKGIPSAIVKSEEVKKVRRWLKEVAHGNREAIADLALFYSNRNFLLEEEQIQTYEEERERWLTELENSNDGDAMFIYASEARERESVKYSWYLKAAERGSRDAAREVAFRLAVGWALKRTSSNRSASETKCWKRLRKREANESRPRRARRLTREKSSLNRPGAEGLC